MHYYEVAPLKIIRATSKSFTYHWPEALPLGQVVQVSVGAQQVVGIIIARARKPTYTTKPLDAVVPLPPLPAPLLATSQWLSDYYATHLATVLQTVLPAGIAKQRRTPRRPASPPPQRRTPPFSLNPQQEEAVRTIRQASPGTVLLHGVTGSGKTAVYIELARQALAAGRSVIVLVPEIALTPQLVAEFRQHFADIILTHSRQTEAERHRAWLAALTSPQPRVAIGPRSALFLPLQHLGYIIIDEAHEASYKQDKSPRYSALRAASVLAQHHGATVVQGSATPLVSEYYLAQKAQRPIATLPSKARPEAIAPTIQLVNLTQRSNLTQHRFLSNQLITAIDATLAADQQILLFHNRRGSANVSLCTNCGWAAECPRCFAPLTLHADRHQLQCHICGYHTTVPTMCPTCHSTDIVHRGIGTKLIEAEVAARWPQARIVRFDGDSSSPSSLEQQYQALYDGTANIIIGTQVVAKGLDLPQLRTVGVVQADAGLALPDYTTNERIFELLAQVVGRVGRSAHATTVVVQAYQPQHPVIQAGLAQDYTAFYHQALTERRRGQFPPFVHLLKLTCVYKTEAAAIRNSQALAQHIRQHHPAVSILGPTPAFHERLRDTYRWQLVIKATQRRDLLAVIASVPAKHWQVDIDPQSLL